MISKKQIKSLRNRFSDYVNRYYGIDDFMDENVRIKDAHSHRVCSNCIAVAKSLNLSQLKINMAEAIGLYHDIGRFEQLKRFQTLNDKITVNHGELGVEMLDLEGFFEMLSPEVQKTLRLCILHHNSKELPKKVGDKVIFYLKILRDADKLDILYVLTRYYSSKRNGSNPALSHNLPDLPGFSVEVVEDVMGNRCVDSKHERSINDSKLLQLSWVFDLNFQYSLKVVQDNKYMEKILEVLPDTEQVRQIGAHVLGYISQKLKR